MNPLTLQIADLENVWKMPIFIGMILCVLSIMNHYRRAMGGVVVITWGYVVIGALYLLEFPGSLYGLYNTAFQATSGQTLAELLLVPIAVLITKRSTLKILLMCLIIAEIILVTWRGYGVMGAPSFDTALIACFLPFAPLWLSIPSLMTIVAHHGSTAILIVIAQLVAYAWKDKTWRLITIFTIPILIAVAYAHQHGAWFDSFSRIDAYKRFMGSWWKQNWVIKAFGFGPGSFMWLSLMLDNYKEPMFLQMHSDWLQIVFELGIVGFSLVTWLFFSACRACAKNTHILAALFGCAAFALTYHPLRFFPSMVMVGFIMKKALYREGYKA